MWRLLIRNLLICVSVLAVVGGTAYYFRDFLLSCELYYMFLIPGLFAGMLWYPAEAAITWGRSDIITRTLNLALAFLFFMMWINVIQAHQIKFLM